MSLVNKENELEHVLEMAQNDTEQSEILNEPLFDTGGSIINDSMDSISSILNEFHERVSEKIADAQQIYSEAVTLNESILQAETEQQVKLNGALTYIDTLR